MCDDLQLSIAAFKLRAQSDGYDLSEYLYQQPSISRVIEDSLREDDPCTQRINSREADNGSREALRAPNKS